MNISASFIKARHALRALQRAPEPVRRKWQRGVSAATFVIIIAGWVAYLNLTLALPADPARTTSEEPGFFATLGKGFGVLGDTLSAEWERVRAWGNTLWSRLDARLSTPSVFTFTREESPFTPTLPETVPPQTLPISE